MVSIALERIDRLWGHMQVFTCVSLKRLRARLGNCAARLSWLLWEADSGSFNLDFDSEQRGSLRWPKNCIERV